MSEYIASKVAKFTRSPASCGIIEMHHLPESGASTAAFQLANHLYHKANVNPCAFVMWSDVADNTQVSRGLALANFLTEMKLGTIITSNRLLNPRTSNVIQVYIFEPSHTEFKAWYTQQVMTRLDV